MEQKHSNEETKMKASEKFMELQDEALKASARIHKVSEKAGVGGLDSLIRKTEQRIKDSKMQNQRPLVKSNIHSSDQIDR